MSIPETQLDTWAHQGSIVQSSSTYSTIKGALEAAQAPYATKSIEVFLQGSYGNDTNIYAESDVDIVIRLGDCFQHDLSELSDGEKSAFQAAHSNATYTHTDFKRDVVQTLKAKYGGDAAPGTKAITIAASGSRRKADVIAAIKFRRYHKFNGLMDQRYDEGICFYTTTGQQIVNYPKQHSANMTAKHQSSSLWFKPMVRILKNLRGKLVDDGRIAGDVAPSYYLEGLLYNVPDDQFGGSYGDSFVNCVKWIQAADRSKFVCANEQYYLLYEGSPVTWRTAQCDQFLAAAVALWNGWR
ncbi:MAG TPA: nucleotidyltransferase [Thermoanaerobaculia bacterium]|nr:nucleotidyltransferase [Thermoanaerobaculia bacterium]